MRRLRVNFVVYTTFWKRIALLPSIENHAQSDWRILADLPSPILASEQEGEKFGALCHGSRSATDRYRSAGAKPSNIESWESLSVPSTLAN